MGSLLPTTYNRHEGTHCRFTVGAQRDVSLGPFDDEPSEVPALTSSRRMSIISNLETPEKLDEMYDRIIRLLSKGLRHEQVLAWRIFL